MPQHPNYDGALSPPCHALWRKKKTNPPRVHAFSRGSETHQGLIKRAGRLHCLRVAVLLDDYVPRTLCHGSRWYVRAPPRAVRLAFFDGDSWEDFRVQFIET
jgi:hypothetical protein